MLGRVGVEIANGQEDLRVLFYSSVSPPLDQRHAELTTGKLYRSHISPADCEYLSCPFRERSKSDAVKTLVKIPIGPPPNRIMTRSTAM